MATTTAQDGRSDGRSPGRGRKALGRVLLYGAIFTWGAGTLLGMVLEWSPGLVLNVPAGVMLALWAALVGTGAIEPETDAASVPTFALVGGLCALAAVGFGLESADSDGPWSVLMVPAIVAGGMWCLWTAISGRRSRAFHERSGTWDSYWGVRFGLLLFGVTWPFLGLVALGLVD